MAKINIGASPKANKIKHSLHQKQQVKLGSGYSLHQKQQIKVNCFTKSKKSHRIVHTKSMQYTVAQSGAHI
jgi:hypothetical protein